MGCIHISNFICQAISSLQSWASYVPGPTVGMSMAGPFRFSTSPHQTVCSLAQPEESLTLQSQEGTCSKVLLAQESQVIEPSFQAAARDTHGA